MGTSKFETSILMVITMIAANASHNVTILTLKVHGTTKVIYIKGPSRGPHFTFRKTNSTIHSPHSISSLFIMYTSNSAEWIPWISKWISKLKVLNVIYLNMLLFSDISTQMKKFLRCFAELLTEKSLMKKNTLTNKY